MATSLDTRIRRMVGTLVAVTVITLVAAGSALAGGRPAASYYTKQQLEAMSQGWAVKSALSSLTPQQRKALLQVVTANATLVRTSQASGFQWGDFGIGAASMLGIVLLAGGGALAARHSRRSSAVPARAAA
jgi:hypothetical protein